jgi:hypothetical protein
MTIENQVTSFELSMRLHELGVKTPSHFYWLIDENKHKLINNNDDDFIIASFDPARLISAYLASELGELLGEYEGVFYAYRNKGSYIEYIVETDEHSVNDLGSEANARAKMLIYLMEL